MIMESVVTKEMNIVKVEISSRGNTVLVAFYSNER